MPEVYRGKPEWKQKVMEQLVNLSVEKKVTKDSKLVKSKEFKLSDDFPLFINNWFLSAYFPIMSKISSEKIEIWWENEKKHNYLMYQKGRIKETRF